jgi:hypothetical protein
VKDQHDLTQTTLSLNYFLHGRQDKVQVNYVWKREGVGNGRHAVPQMNNDALVVQFQKFF